jgi:uridine monophosphate synthetase
MDFFSRIEEIVANKHTSLCIGLDPFFSSEERAVRGDEACLEAALAANLRIVETTAPYAACYKPNLAFYEAFGPAGLVMLEKTLAAIPSDIPVIIDAKRGDIDSTARAYADAIFGRLSADAVTLSPYMGRDSIDPFLAWEGKGVFVLCRTSNPGAGVFQDLPQRGSEPLYLRVAREAAAWSPRVGLVVAGNDPEALAAARKAAPEAWFLSPGIGAQGGKADVAMRAGARADGSGVLVMAARAIAGAVDPGAAAKALRDEINRAVRNLPAGRPSASEKAVQAGKDELRSLKDGLVQGLVSTGCFRLGEFILKSGKKSPFYIDLRRLISDPAVLALAGQAYASLAGKASFDRLAGIPAAGLPLATAAGLALKVPMIWPRMPAKEHGTGNRVEGAFAAGERALLLDDLITTGASKLEAIDILRGEGLVIEDLVVLIERGIQGRKDMESAGVRLHAFLQVNELFEACERLGIIDAATRQSLEDYVASGA